MKNILKNWEREWKKIEKEFNDGTECWEDFFKEKLENMYQQGFEAGKKEAVKKVKEGLIKWKEDMMKNPDNYITETQVIIPQINEKWFKTLI